MVQKEKLFILLVFALGSFLRFYNLMFDHPFFFNPDERNMAGAVTQFRLPKDPREWKDCLIPEKKREKPPVCELNPHFFAYGQFPLYLAFASDQVAQLVEQTASSTPKINESFLATPFHRAVLWLRIWSAVASSLLILVVFAIARRILPFFTTLMVTLFVAGTPGLIQAAHFGTTESFLTLFFFGALLCALWMLEENWATTTPKIAPLTLTGIIIGLALGSKLTGVFFFLPPLFAGIVQIFRILRHGQIRPKWPLSLMRALFALEYLVFIAFLFCIISSPYNLVEIGNFRSAVFGYEKDVATGAYQAFYTRQFINTTPILFQMQHVLPYALGWPVYIGGTAGFVLLGFFLFRGFVQRTKRAITRLWQRVKALLLKKRGRITRIDAPISFATSAWMVIICSFVAYLLPTASLFVKWTRFMTPIVPFFALFAGFFLSHVSFLLQKKSYRKSSFSFPHLISNFPLLFFCFIALLPGIAFLSIYANPDSRLAASAWIYETIPDRSYILFETANVIDIPIGAELFPNAQNKTFTMISFDFYHLDENPQLVADLLTHLEKADYFFIPSRRVFANHQRFPERFPILNRFYDHIFAGNLGFEKVEEFSSFPTLTFGPLSFSLADEESEESATVFDHPVIRIYKKTRSLSAFDYQRFLLQNQ